ncbi:ABC transporter ATP-binding protein [Bulleidia sp. zg-1006]|uniref:ABC transporter ATP-binding protein n=1 Tax=Bulleidia sp. zg-1006 TaxID=2806552 RepID=UPI00193ADA6D|nr:ABC transporter ATP-binding protein [Bulleidia sp. zg-1006]QRG86558.1 ABC transporter ATP-binding protein [Bulleidia sp. zg-1006]
MKKKFSSKTSLLLHFVRGAKRYFFASIIFSFLVAVLQLINPRIIGYTVDAILDQQETKLPPFLHELVNKFGGVLYLQKNLWMIALAIIGVALLSMVLRYLSEINNQKGSETLVRNMRHDLYNHILSLPYAWHGTNHTGDIIQRATSDVDTIRNFLTQQLLALVRTLIFVCTVSFFMVQENWQLTIIAFAFSPLIVWLGIRFSQRFSKQFEKADEEEGVLSSIVQENLTGIRVVRAFGREVYEKERFDKQNKYYTGLWIGILRELSVFWARMDTVSILQKLTIITVGAYFTVLGWMSAGSYIAFVAYNVMLEWPIRSLGRVISNMSKAGVSIDRLAYIMNSEEEKDVPEAKEVAMNQDIHFRHVSFRYGKDLPWVLKDINLDIKAGTTIGILGATGSGKSSLMYLLNRLYTLEEGQGSILIGDTNVNEIQARWLRKNIGMVLQEPYLFSRSLKENIRIAKQEAGQVEVEAVARTAALEEAINHFSKGYETYVGERGVTLSGGQKQRTAIAQMLIRETPIMVFDDSLSAVDAETDAKIRQAIHDGSKKSTVILITHRISTLMKADQIVIFDKGRIVQRGTHEELLAQEGTYRHIYELQSRQTE